MVNGERRWYTGVIEAESPEQAASVLRERVKRFRGYRATTDQIQYVEVWALPTGEFLGEF
jgi:hypothetical protein